MSKIKMGYSIGSKKEYADFKKDHQKSTISRELRNSILRDINNLIADDLIETGEPFKIPYGLGTLRICKTKPLKKKVQDKDGNDMYTLKINPKATKEAGKKVYYLNLHTEGYYARFKWLRSRLFLKYGIIWKLTMMRDHTRKLSKVLQTQPGKIHDYITYTPDNKYNKLLLT